MMPSGYGYSQSYGYGKNQLATTSTTANYSIGGLSKRISDSKKIPDVPCWENAPVEDADIYLVQGETQKIVVCFIKSVAPISCIYKDGRITSASKICGASAEDKVLIECSADSCFSEKVSGKILSSSESLLEVKAELSVPPKEDKCYQSQSTLSVLGCPGTVKEANPYLIVLEKPDSFYSGYVIGDAKRKNRSYGVTTATGSSIISWVNPENFSLSAGDKINIQSAGISNATVVRSWVDNSVNGMVGLAELSMPANTSGCFPAVAETGILGMFAVSETSYGCMEFSISACFAIPEGDDVKSACGEYSRIGCYQIFKSVPFAQTPTSVGVENQLVLAGNVYLKGSAANLNIGNHI
jgi:hypothetical protein